MTKPTQLISTQTVIKIIFVMLGFWLLFLIRDLILLLFVSLIIVSALNPLVDRLEVAGVPRPVAAGLVFLILLIIIGEVLYLMIPPLVRQTQELVNKLPDIANQAVALLVFWGDKVKVERWAHLVSQNLIEIITNQMSKLPFQVFRFGKGLVNGVLLIFSLLVISFYLLVENRRLKKQFVSIFPEKKQKRIQDLIINVERKLGGWLRGQAILSLIVGVSSWVVLSLLRLEFALPLAILAGLLEIIPIIGPVLATLAAAIVALSGGLVRGIFVIILYWGMQQLENNLVVPQVMKETVGLDPLLVILALTIGARLLGIFGALLAVPLTATAVIIINDFLISKNLKK